MKEDKLKEIGMHGGATKEIFLLARMLRSKMSKPEKELWAFLQTKPLGLKFRRQHPFGKYILDFYCHPKRLSIEIDGIDHEIPDQRAYDLNRKMILMNYGISEIRFKNEEILNDLNKVIEEIIKAVN
jgi:cyclase